MRELLSISADVASVVAALCGLFLVQRSLSQGQSAKIDGSDRSNITQSQGGRVQ